jgi:hypothetical protein
MVLMLLWISLKKLLKNIVINMGKKNSCTLVPKVKGTNKPSKLYKGLNENPNLKNDRLTVNYIYASYLQ